MEKIWYILINESEEGPFTAKELWFDSRIDLETLVWKEGLSDWTPLKNIRELRKYFEPEEPSQKRDEKADKNKTCGQGEIALDYSHDPNFFFFFIVIALLLLCFLLYYTQYAS